MPDFIFNGQATGDVASTLLAHGGDPNMLRPFVGNDGRSYVNVQKRDAYGQPVLNEQGKPTMTAMVTNAAATLRKEAWITFDQAVLKVARQRLNAVADLRNAGLVYNVPNGMATTVLQHEAESDTTAATISMDGIRESEADRPVYDLRNLPLPIIHKDFGFPLRQILASRQSGSPLDTTSAEQAARKVAEQAEKLLLGTAGSYTYGGGVVYGYTNFPSRLTKVLTAPTAANHPTTNNQVLAMRKQSTDAGYYGPWTLYYSPAWYTYMDEDYTAAVAQTWTLRERLAKIEGITAIKPADYLTGTTLLLVQNTPDVAREVVGMDIKTVQWETKGGMELKFKVMAILVPQLRADYAGNTGIVHGSV